MNSEINGSVIFKIGSRFLLSLILFSYVSVFISGQEASAWILLERGINSYEKRNLDNAANYFLNAIKLSPEYPEAEYWLGNVYLAQGSSILALEHYRRAIAYSVYLRNPDDKIVYLYALSDLLLQIRSEDKNEAVPSSAKNEAVRILQGISDNESSATPRSIDEDHRYIQILTQNSLDDLIYLYRMRLGPSLKARMKLGEISWESRQYRAALLHSTRVVLSLMSTLAQEYRAVNNNWRFDIDLEEDRKQPDKDVRLSGPVDGTLELLNRIYGSEPKLAKWLRGKGFWAQLYLLSVSLYATGFEASARSIWSLMVMEDVSGKVEPKVEAGRWGRFALRQLEEPFISTDSLAP